MFLAWKEIKHDKLRYGLITLMIMLVSYLIFILTSLAIGLAGQNTQAINTWEPQSIVLNKDANINISQSKIMTDQVQKMDLNQKKSAVIGDTPVVVTGTSQKKLSAQFVGLNSQQYIYKNLNLTSGKQATKPHEVVVDTQLQQNGYKLGDKIKLNSSKIKYKIVGFTKNAKLNIAPIVYGSLSDWHQISGLDTSIAGNAVISKQKLASHNTQLHSYDVQTVIQNLPGYSAQNLTFSFMIGFLMIISLIVIAVFLYILTMQKIQNYAVLRAQGIPAGFLVRSTLIQSGLLVDMGIIASLFLTIGTIMALPAAVPIQFSIPIIGLTIVGLFLTTMIGAIVPSLMIVRIDPAEAIGG
ncbi:ABC transporter permease [Fructilactobacillus sanfranciscensis]|uniref:ABC transporter permease n=1 Tax=Fructilactobacillus sanfranciscensis TaxID=1625 RepID=UPI0037565E6F